MAMHALLRDSARFAVMAVGMVLAKVLSLREAYESVDWSVIVLELPKIRNSRYFLPSRLVKPTVHRNRFLDAGSANPQRFPAERMSILRKCRPHRAYTGDQYNEGGRKLSHYRMRLLTGT